MREVKPKETVILATLSWPQIDNNGIQVPAGFYDIIGEVGDVQSNKVRIQIISSMQASILFKFVSRK